MLVPHKSTTPAWVAFIRGGEKDDKCKTVSMKVGLAFFIDSQEILTSSIAGLRLQSVLSASLRYSGSKMFRHYL